MGPDIASHLQAGETGKSAETYSPEQLEESPAQSEEELGARGRGREDTGQLAPASGGSPCPQHWRSGGGQHRACCTREANFLPSPSLPRADPPQCLRSHPNLLTLAFLPQLPSPLLPVTGWGQGALGPQSQQKQETQLPGLRLHGGCGRGPGVSPGTSHSLGCVRLPTWGSQSPRLGRGLLKGWMPGLCTAACHGGQPLTPTWYLFSSCLSLRRGCLHGPFPESCGGVAVGQWVQSVRGTIRSHICDPDAQWLGWPQGDHGRELPFPLTFQTEWLKLLSQVWREAGACEEAAAVLSD